MPATKPIIGLCGGVGAGKSRVATEFARHGCVVVDSDALSHEVLQRRDVAAQLVEWWGRGILDAAGHVDRRKVGEIVFADEHAKGRLETLVHPLIGARRQDIIKQAGEDPAVKAIILNSPLLFESRLDRLCDAIVFVQASEQCRLERVRRSRGWDAAELRRRERWQKPLAYKRSRSEFTVENEGSEDQIGPQVKRIIEQIAARCRAQA